MKSSAAIIVIVSALPAPVVSLAEEEIRRKNRSKHGTAQKKVRDNCLAIVAVKAQMRSTIAQMRSTITNPS